MIQATTLKFLKDLKKNNNKPWFDKHRTDYEKAKADFSSLLEQVIPGISKFDPPIANLTVKECIFRINRDVRFSKDKHPYKNNIAGYFNQGGKKSNGAGYYLHIEPGNSFAGGGMWVPLPADLAKIRQEIDYNLDAWKKLTASSTFKKNFRDGLDKTDMLVRPPKGYEEANPAIDFLKMKSFVVHRRFSDAEIQDKGFIKELLKTFSAMQPLVGFLNKAIE
jgi:uncharacterized protein (TIGR02453 family)